MENTLYIALARQTGLWNQLDMVANNLANMNTVGYKSLQPHFTEYLSKSKTDEKLLDDRLSFVHDFGIVRDFTPGALSSTGNPLDLAIHGDGYFVVETPDVPVWAAKGRTRADLSLPFDLKTDQEVLDRIGYTSSTVIAVNAQTGQVYDFYNDKRPDRRYVPHIITWDEVK